tara:strand:+ start:69 stop:641 length:573 start_codon:yes stop_codon:yes gene_type:complete
MKEYIIKELSYIKDNKETFVKNAKLAHERFVFNYGVPFDKMSSTWFYRYYNVSTLTVGCPMYHKFFIDLQKTLRKIVNSDKPLWYQSWLNFHDQNALLNDLPWHDHPDCLFHGYVSIDPKETETEFKTFKIKNEIGKMYIGPGGYLHRVNVLKPFEGKRITIAFDVVDEECFKRKIINNADVNTGFMPLP